LTAKPFIYVFNIDEGDIGDTNIEKNLQDLVSPFDSICLCAKIEDELKTLDQKDASELLAELGQGSSGLDRLAKVGFATLGLQTYLTAGPKEVRAWTIKQGSTAPEAAGVIHTDFQKGFIKAEIVSFSDLVTAKSLVSARALGKARLEGKDYIMQDGDVVEFRFNV
jgi:ribosome-binding ATPase YchF (GTP1/OBG family)